ncbi:hypothetical protein D3C86_1030700 [compost metagenome]
MRLGRQVIAVDGRRHLLGGQGRGHHQADILPEGGLQLLQKILGGKLGLIRWRLGGQLLIASCLGRRQRFGIQSGRSLGLVTPLTGRWLLSQQLGSGHGIGKCGLAVRQRQILSFPPGEERGRQDAVGRDCLAGR